MLIIKNNNEWMNEWMISNILAWKVYQLLFFRQWYLNEML